MAQLSREPPALIHGDPRRVQGAVVVVSIFVNPLTVRQRARNLDRLQRTLDDGSRGDAAGANADGRRIAFTPTDATCTRRSLYLSAARDRSVRNRRCRQPRHFAGVLPSCSKLLQMRAPR